MTPRETHLREALAQAKYKFGMISCIVDNGWAERGAVDAEKAMQEADLMNDGLSEEGRARMKLIVETRERYGKGPDHSETIWMEQLLKYYMGIE